MMGQYAPAAALVVVASLAVLTILFGGIPASCVSEPTDTPYDTDMIATAGNPVGPTR